MRVFTVLYCIAEVTPPFGSMIMSIFQYGIEVWGCAFESKYISRIDKLCKRAFKSGYTADYTPFASVMGHFRVAVRGSVSK